MRPVSLCVRVVPGPSSKNDWRLRVPPTFFVSFVSASIFSFVELAQKRGPVEYALYSSIYTEVGSTTLFFPTKVPNLSNAWSWSGALKRDLNIRSRCLREDNPACSRTDILYPWSRLIVHTRGIKSKHRWTVTSGAKRIPKMFSALLAFVVILPTFVNAQGALYSQCGGIGWTGATSCVQGATCQELNAYYFQCLPGTATTTTIATSTSHTTTTIVSTSTSTASTSTASVPAQTGFVKTSGTRFTLNGAPYTVFGTNAYWLPLGGYSTTDINTALTTIVGSGATTVRTWGFNEVTSPNGIYFHLWSGSTATVNTGANGLGMLDTVIAAAKAHGVRLIISLTNNWSDYGGMDVYAAQLLGSGQFHDVFYTNPTIIAAFKTYVQAVVTRYVNEPTIMAWELANEPRCAGSSTTASPTCNNTVITTWASTMSAFIKSIDSNHLVAIGDEGFFNDPGNFDYPYSGTIGIDFAANMKISTLDFGTFHMYPGSWGESNTVPWGQQWITDHATVMTSSNKPVIMEEFGVTSDSTRNATYAAWYQTVITTGLTGDLIWQAGADLTNGPTANDGYAIFPTDPVYELMQTHAAALEARG
ncbi:glycoside hydrolase superfamily [Mycena galericulata]|nr:glycoside hydrolase superfamily [Mycena galericulata]